jgi:hypothetical protein
VTSDTPLIIANEFATIEITVDTVGHDPRLCLHDLATGAIIRLDALMLSGLARVSLPLLQSIMDPATAQPDD